jgi:hypothetical protein
MAAQIASITANFAANPFFTRFVSLICLSPLFPRPPAISAH